MRRLSLFAIAAMLVAFSFGCTVGTHGDPQRRQAAPNPGVKLVVLVVIDQLPAWVFRSHLPHFDKGFARLRRDGAYVIDAEIPYATPFTAPGHATIGTGTTPDVHGILGNSWWRRADGKERTAEFDPDATPFSVAPTQDGELDPDDSASGRALRVDGIADALRLATSGRGRSLAIALKPRAAAFMIGRRPDLAVWYEAAAGGMTTSSAYAKVVPPWLLVAAKDYSARRYFDRIWSADGAAVARITGKTDDNPGEGGVHGLDTTFPHDLAASERPARAFLHTPYADQLVVDTMIPALTAMELGRDDTPDLLALGFNAHDYGGHLWGPESWEAFEIERQLDSLLGTLFDTLDSRIGRDRWAVVVTSDHGMTPLVDRSPHPGARRVPVDEVRSVAESAVAATLGEGPWVAKVIASNIYFTPAFARVSSELRQRALGAAAIAVADLPGIARAGSTEDAMQRCLESTTSPHVLATLDPLDRAVCRSLVRGESGELYVLPDRGSLITDYKTGSHHDAPFDDNRRVPIFVMAPGLKPTAALQPATTPATLLQVAPTIAALIGIPPPRAATAPPLFGLQAR